MEELAKSILAVLRQATQPLMAGEIADRLNRQRAVEVNRREVNRCLHGSQLKGRVVQDASYRWRPASARTDGERADQAAEATSPRAVRERSVPWDRFGRVVAYYRDVLLEDEGTAARLFLTDEGHKFLEMPLDTEWSVSGRGQIQVALEGSNSRFAAALRQARATAALYYGYPLYVDWISHSRSGWTGGFAIPVFLQPVEYEIQPTGLSVALVPDWPVVNPEFIRRLRTTPEERREFLQTLGLMEAEGEPPEGGLAEIALRMASEFEWDSVIERLDPESISRSPPIRAIDRPGFYNRAVLVLGERPPYTRGLERELPLLQEKVTDEELKLSALRLFFTESEPGRQDDSETGDGGPYAEVVPLNDEQREAVRSSFENPLTVVTGPPGTGKSQVVLSVLANAYLRGERVVFSSRNNKAVDVVESRLNALSRHPLLIRTGRYSGDRDLRREIARFIMQVLSVVPTAEDREAEAEASRRIGEYREKRDRLWERLDRVRHARNLVDALDRKLLEAREVLPQTVCNAICAAGRSLVDPGIGKALDLAEKHLSRDVGVLKRIGLWFRRRRDLDAIVGVADELERAPEVFGELPSAVVSPQNLPQWREYLKECLRRIEFCHAVADYRSSYATLRELPNVEEFAEELAGIEAEMWRWGARYIAARGLLLTDRLEPETRRALGEYRSTMERLTGDQIGGRAVAQLMRELASLFGRVSKVLPIWCVTNLSVHNALPFESGLFDLVVIDEASQCDIPSALPLLYRARRALIIGDPNQLRHIAAIPPYRDQQLQSKHGLTRTADQPFTFCANSLFDLAATCAGRMSVVMLREHFRSHSDIIAFSNRTWYRDSLLVCTDYRRLARGTGQEPGIQWTQVPGTVRQPSRGGALNEEEAQRVVDELKRLLVDRGFAGTVGVVTPFRAQANRIRDLVNDQVDISLVEKSDLICDTAHGFQGDERDVIFFSPCMSRSMPRGANWFLSATGNLFNVAITRARALLHVVGDIDACLVSGVPHIEQFARYVADLGSDRAAGPGSGRGRPGVGPWEQPFCEALREAGLRPMPQYLEHQYWLDLAIKEGSMWLDVEVDGELYHKEWDGSRCRRDVIRDLRLTALGWTVKRFWVYQLRDEMEACVEEVLRIIRTGRKM